MKHKRRSTDDAGPAFYVVAIAPESDIASSVIRWLSDTGLVAKGGEGSRVWGFQICCTDFARARAAIMACSILVSTGAKVLPKPKRDCISPMRSVVRGWLRKYG